MSADGLKRNRLTKSQLVVELLEDRTLLSAAVPVQLMDSSSTDYDPSSILVRFRSGVSIPATGDVILKGTTIGYAVAPLLVPGLHEILLPPDISVPEAMAVYNASPLVEYAEPAFNLYLTDTIPNDPMWSQLSGMRRIQTPVAWDLWQGSGGTVIASIDTGVDYNHTDLAGNMWPYLGYNFISPSQGPLDDNGHGSHTSGTMAAIGNNAVGVVGVNWYAQIMALKVFNAQGSGSTTTAISAMNYAVQQGVFVSNNSYGCQGCFQQSFLNALQTADAYYHVFVAAAGNSNRNTDTTPFYPANYGVSVGNVISVAATNATSDSRASFSNYGPNTVHLGAPGANIRSTYRNNSYATLSGTSMAAPHVAGAMALMIDYYGIWGTPAEMRDWLIYTTDYVGLPVISGGRLNVARLMGAAGPTPGGSGGGEEFGFADLLVTQSLEGAPQEFAFGFREALPPAPQPPLPFDAPAFMAVRAVAEQALPQEQVSDGNEQDDLFTQDFEATAYYNKP